MSEPRIPIERFGEPSEGPLSPTDPEDLAPLPSPYDSPGSTPAPTPLSDAARAKYEADLDGIVALGIPRPKDEAEERALLERFLAGLERLFRPDDNWTFLRPLLLSMEHCAHCHTCSDACHVYEMSGRNPIYRPAYRSEILRRLYRRYVRKGGHLLADFRGGKIRLTWRLVARLAELAHRCNLCRRCAQTCPMGVDNGLVAREIRKLFSQEMGIAAKEVHAEGSVQQLAVGSSTGMTPAVVRDNIDFIDEDMEDRTGIPVRTPWDVAGADVLLIHNAGEILAWPENPGAFALVLEAAGIRWTMSSEIAAYDGVNYGVWYDDAQFARVAIHHARAAKRLGVKKIVIGECGHAHKALTVIADRVLTGELAIPRESSMTLLAEIVAGGRLRLDPSRNDFPVTLHDPCNLVRLMGVVEPQRRVLRAVAPRFREMTPHGVENYCCGGGSGFAIMSGHNFPDFRFQVAGRKKFEQILNAFAGELDPSIPKYVCAPCSNCKGQIRDLLDYYGVWERHRILYGGLVELVVNAMADARPGFIEWEWR